MKGNGGKINSMDGVTKFGQMELNLKAAMNKELKLGKVNSNFQTVQLIKESLQKTYHIIAFAFMAMVDTNGQTVGNITVNGNSTCCMDKEHSFGQMEMFTLVSLSKIRKKATVSFDGMMEDSMMDSGWKENSMVQVSTCL